MAIFFTADTHFGLNDYEGTIARDFRPFKTPKEMSRKIIKIWNKQAGKNDVIYHLGDFINYNFKDKESYVECLKLVKKIKAKVILILGNNEKRVLRYEFNDDFKKFKEFLLNIDFADVYEDDLYLELGGYKFYLNHYPKNHKDGYINLFGHIHGTGFVKKYGFNIGIDNHYLSMFSEEDILRLIKNRELFDENVYD